MTLAEYDRRIKPHLHAIEAGALMAAKHARALEARPGFETFAESELRETREVLRKALALIITAQAFYEQKPVEA